MIHRVLIFFVLVYSVKANTHRIIGGDPISIKQAPYQVTLSYKEQHLCGGALISPKCVLTASHCLQVMQPYAIKVRAGMTRLTDKSKDETISKIFKHDNYNETTLNNDLAILKLHGPLQGKNIKTIHLTNTTVKVGQEVTISGFGFTAEEGPDHSNILRDVDVNIVSKESCAEDYVGYNDITDSMICAMGEEGRKDACQGDSGGPVVSKKQLVGIVSWGIGCARPEYAGVFANVKYLRPWIDRIVKQNC